MNQRDPRTYAIIGTCMAVHSELGPGFLEPVYHDALKVEFELRGTPFQHEFAIPVFYKDQRLSSSYRADFVCFDSIIVEIKAINALTGVEEAQILNYLKATKYEVGLLINFGAKSLEYKRLGGSKWKS